jgi:SAM-dependent methyltransferase/uracil phosphoribosyltransferase
MITSKTEVRTLYDLLQNPSLSDVDAKAIIAILACHLAEETRLKLNKLVQAKMLLIPILRGGLLLYPAFAEAFPRSAVGLLHIVRAGNGRTTTHECLPNVGDVDVVLYLDAVAGTGATIDHASKRIRQRYQDAQQYACVVSSSSEATANLTARGLTVLGISIDEDHVDGLVAPDLGVRDAGDLLSFPRQGDATLPDFPIAAFEKFHDVDEQARKLRDQLIYQPTLDVACSKRFTSILDIGCGRGRLTEMLAKQAAVVVGYDSSAEAVAIANRRAETPRVRYTTDISPEMVRFFDLIVCCMVLNSTLEYERVIQTVADCSAPESTQVWTILHPAFQFNESQWRARKSVSLPNLSMSYSLLPSYFEEHPFRKRIGDLTLTEYHRPLSAYVNTLTRHGFVIAELIEPQARLVAGSAVERFLPRTLVIVTRSVAAR